MKKSTTPLLVCHKIPTFVANIIKILDFLLMYN